MDPPLAYLITWTCYGTWLHGNEFGSVDRDHNVPGSAYVAHQPGRRQYEREHLKGPPYQLEEPQRQIVLRTIWDVCEFRGWELVAAHVLDCHVHVVVSAGVRPEDAMDDFKAYASRALNGMEGRRENRWTRHGSTRYVDHQEGLEGAIRYVYEGQPATMARWKVGEPPPALA